MAYYAVQIVPPGRVKVDAQGRAVQIRKMRRGAQGLSPGHAMTKRRRATSEYNAQLREKQKIRRIYGVLERNSTVISRRQPRTRASPAKTFCRMLELRLDNIVYRSGLPPRAAPRGFWRCTAISASRQKGSIFLHIQVKEGDICQVREKEQKP